VSAAELRRQADAKDELAERVQREAARLPDLLDGVAARVGPDVWRGPAAERFGDAVRRWRSRLDAEAETLLAVARRLRVRAEELRAEARRIEAAEALAEQRRAEALRDALERRMLTA
jgi:uncharacterized protein YukE